ncbi:hypothetical protein HLB44_22065 [Aquincola sp. S2]|uniref:Uncharacterized protein n=1 Tax=Pseudaquabacterium terrae TaxID=2732868 RepID=A0ABX2EM39_9BURK|nr:hypothetical protein [Aquabacterium terrae]NRF69695.1 hypothetical protein [Aquabacterium terrae]
MTTPTHPPAATALPLQDLLDGMGSDLARIAPPPLAPRVVRTLRRVRPPAWRRLVFGFPGAVLCALALFGSVVLVLQDDGPWRGERLDPPQDQAGLSADSGFVPVAGAERWQHLLRGEDAAAAWVVPSELPRERLAALGLPYDPSRAGETVRAELLLHSSGELLAVRVLHR